MFADSILDDLCLLVNKIFESGQVTESMKLGLITPVFKKKGSNTDSKNYKLPTMYWLPKLHKRPYKARFIANSSSCTTTELSKLLTSCLTAIKSHVIRYCETVYETSNKNWFWSIKNSGEVLSKLKCRGFRATSLSTYDFSTLYTTLPHNLIKEKLLDLIEWTFKRALKNYGSLYLACNDRKAFFTSSDQSRYTLWSCQNVCDALSYLLDNIYTRFGTKAPGRFAQKPVPPGTVRAKNFFRTGRFLPGRFAHFSKN